MYLRNYFSWWLCCSINPVKYEVPHRDALKCTASAFGEFKPNLTLATALALKGCVNFTGKNTNTGIWKSCSFPFEIDFQTKETFQILCIRKKYCLLQYALSINILLECLVPVQEGAVTYGVWEPLKQKRSNRHVCALIQLQDQRFY